jgi:hypothetical protein
VSSGSGDRKDLSENLPIKRIVQELPDVSEGAGPFVVIQAGPQPASQVKFTDVV